ncbi:MAG: CehA/McbA family metallohydrolase, partial [Clostridiales bacterium]|nr:CehA/McbA family metallohydrolase [Clostridiales bacterium]
MKKLFQKKTLLSGALAAMLMVGTFPSAAFAASEAELTEAGSNMDYHLKLDGNLDNENGDSPIVNGFTGTQTYVDGRKGQKAISLSRSNYFELDKADDLIDYNQSFSVAYWIKVNSTSGSDPAVMSNKNWSSGGNNGWMFTAKSGMIKLNSKSRSDSGRVNGSTDIEITRYTAGQWVHIAAVWDKDANRVKTYANGVLTNDYPTNLAQGIPGNGKPTMIGQSWDNNTALYNTASMYVNFDLQEFVMTDRALTAGEVAELYGEKIVAPIAYTLTTDKTDAEIGDIVTTTLKIENPTGETYSSISARLITSATSSVTPQLVKSVPTPLADGESAELTWETEITAGGLVSVFALIDTDSDGQVRLHASAINVPFDSAGWYKIDSHSHTTYSDGGGSVAQNQDQAKLNGVNSLVLTDHGTSGGWNDALSYLNSHPEMVPIRGNEYTHSNGHAVVLFVNENVNYNSYSWPNMISRAQSMNSLLYIAHPFEGNSWRHAGGWEAEGYNGLEVWNNWWAPRYPYNDNAFKKWDELNRAGRKLSGITDTDAHSVKLVGRSWMSVYLPEGLSRDSIREGMIAGHMYGSNGPHLEFTATADG